MVLCVGLNIADTSCWPGPSSILNVPFGNGRSTAILLTEAKCRGAPFQATLSHARFSNGAATQIKVIQLTGGEAIMQTSDLKYPPADTGGAPATYWVVKERLAANNAPSRAVLRKLRKKR
jgi:hypothetical protein